MNDAILDSINEFLGITSILESYTKNKYAILLLAYLINIQSTVLGPIFTFIGVDIATLARPPLPHDPKIWTKFFKNICMTGQLCLTHWLEMHLENQLWLYSYKCCRRLCLTHRSSHREITKCVICQVVYVVNLVWHYIHDCVIKFDSLTKSWFFFTGCCPVDRMLSHRSCGLADHLLTYWPYDASLRPTLCANVVSIATYFDFIYMLFYQSRCDLCYVMIEQDGQLGMCFITRVLNVSEWVYKEF